MQSVEESAVAIEKREEQAVVSEERSIAASPPVTETALEKAVSLVEENSPLVSKTYEADEGGVLVVKGEAAGLPVIYDMASAITTIAGLIAVPYEIRDNAKTARGKVLWKPEANEREEFPSGVLLGFDDDFAASWEAAFDMFDASDCKVTFFVQGGYTAFWEKAVKRGHEIAWHTVNHLDLRTLKGSDFTKETTAPLAGFRARGFAMRAFAYPFGYSTPETDKTLLRSFRVLRGFGVTPRIYTVEQIRSGLISSKSLDNTVNKNEALFRATVTLLLRVTKFLGPAHILPVTTHDISDKADWGIKPERLAFFLSTARALNLKFYRYSEFF